MFKSSYKNVSFCSWVFLGLAIFNLIRGLVKGAWHLESSFLLADEALFAVSVVGFACAIALRQIDETKKLD